MWQIRMDAAKITTYAKTLLMVFSMEDVTMDIHMVES